MCRHSRQVLIAQNPFFRWLQSAPVAFANVGWKFYLAFIIPGSIGGVVMWVFFPNTKGIPLEEVAAIFGDADEVAVYERDLVEDSQIVMEKYPGLDGETVKVEEA